MINVAENTGNYNNFVEISAITLPAIGAITGYYTSDYFAAAPYVDTQSEKVGVAFQLQF